MMKFRVNYRLTAPGQKPERRHVDFRAADEDNAMAEWMCNRAFIEAEASSQGKKITFSGLLRRTN